MRSIFLVNIPNTDAFMSLKKYYMNISEFYDQYFGLAIDMSFSQSGLDLYIQFVHYLQGRGW